MLSEKINQIITLAEGAKAELRDSILALAPPKLGYFTVKASALKSVPWTATYFDTGHQLRTLADYAVEKTGRSLSAVVKTYREIIETGGSAAFRGDFFSDETRTVLSSVLGAADD